MEWTASQINAQNLKLNVMAGGVMNVSSNAALAQSVGTNALNIAGTLNKSGGTTSINIPCNNTGTVNVDAGTLVLSTGSNNGTVAVDPGATLTFGNTMTHQPGSLVTGGGTISFTGGTNAFPAGTFAPSGTFTVGTSGDVVLNNTVPPSTIGSPIAGTLTVNVGQTFPAVTVTGTLNGTGDFSFPSNLTLSGGFLGGAATATIPVGATLFLGTTTNTISARTVDVAGTVEWTAGQINCQNLTLNVLAGGVMNVSSNAALAQSVGTNALNVAGTLNKSSGTTTVNIPCSNAGTVNVSGGALSLNSSYTQTAGATLISGGSFTKSGSPIALQGGVLGGTGTLTGAVTQTGGSIAPGLSPGLFTITGASTQNATSALDIELGGPAAGTQYDKLVVNAAMTIGGTLRLSFVNGFVPHGGDSFTVLSANSLTGSYSSVDVIGYPDCVATAATVGNTVVVSIESTPPNAVCTNIDVNLSSAGLATITPAMIDGGSSDNCAIASLEASQTEFTCGRPARRW